MASKDDLSPVHNSLVKLLASSSAPGKIILHGEHAVVYGYTALATAINLRTNVDIYEPDTSSAAAVNNVEETVELDFPDIDVNSKYPLSELRALKSKHDEVIRGEKSGDYPPIVDNKDDLLHVPEYDDRLSQLLKEFVNRIHADVDTDENGVTGAQKLVETKVAKLGVVTFLYLYFVVGSPQLLKPCRVKVSSEIPIAQGLGSSAAFCVALAASLYSWRYKQHPSGNTGGATAPPLDERIRDRISQLALLGETILHGKPSGVDNNICSFGQVLIFRRGPPLDAKAGPPVRLNILLVPTYQKRSTSDLVARVRKLKSECEEHVKSIFDSIEKCTTDCVKLLADTNVHVKTDGTGEKQGTYEKLKECVCSNQSLLEQLGISSDKIDLIVTVASKHNLSAKLTGAGGGGCVIVLLPENMERTRLNVVMAELEASGFKPIETVLGVSGVDIAH